MLHDNWPEWQSHTHNARTLVTLPDKAAVTVDLHLGVPACLILEGW